MGIGFRAGEDIQQHRPRLRRANSLEPSSDQAAPVALVDPVRCQEGKTLIPNRLLEINRRDYRLPKRRLAARSVRNGNNLLRWWRWRCIILLRVCHAICQWLGHAFAISLAIVLPSLCRPTLAGFAAFCSNGPRVRQFVVSAFLPPAAINHGKEPLERLAGRFPRLDGHPGDGGQDCVVIRRGAVDPVVHEQQ